MAIAFSKLFLRRMPNEEYVLSQERSIEVNVTTTCTASAAAEDVAGACCIFTAALVAAAVKCYCFFFSLL